MSVRCVCSQVACNVYLLSSSYRDARIGYRDAAAATRHAELKGVQHSRDCCVPAPWGVQPQEPPPAHVETDEELLARRKIILERAKRQVADDEPA